MTYNIKNGGLDGGDRSRLDRILQVVAEQRPDVLALQELRGLRRDRRRLDAVARRLGMRAYLTGGWFGQPVAVLVRRPVEPLRVVPVRRPFHHGAQRIVLATERGPLTVLGTHLHPYSGRRRLREAGWLVGAAGGIRRGRLGRRNRDRPRTRNRGRPETRDGGRPDRGPLPERLVLLMGDLNTLDPDGRHDERIGRLPPEYRGRHLMPDGVTVDTRAVAALYRAGFVDLFAATDPGTEPPDTVPTSAGGGAEFTGMRLDYLLGTPPLARVAQPPRVVTGGAAESASDHYPLVLDLDLDL
ncbi:endonuclease/exonuclease/phosphatase family protein [Micromonospora sp. WMMD1102]|uniref:endonuclease/exonuclease/phosphatase family protein n=1 Tax=Micromonospora sp. WMMD1102 TaxID=3016105 RepID=UPI002414E6F7|nr:endonuclease/exonuclease/phosphatase family protein [Micromonospora sp. WMMD1102]MDG4786237.1 endonuclease/exonuclease/phosphatase family protein [Micromonospora sp. WMMD1102]